MAQLRLAAVAAHFGRDIDRTMIKLEGMIGQARDSGIDLLVLPDATLGGYLPDMRHPSIDALPPALTPDSPEVQKLCRLAGDVVVCFGLTEEEVIDGEVRHYNAAFCVHGDGILGKHRKVHQPLGESLVFAAGDRFEAFDTPIGRLGMMIDYDKTFPESARSLAVDGAAMIACLSAWPASVTDRADRMRQDRQSHLFDLYDCARAAENQVYMISSNQTGVLGGLRFLGQAKIVGPGGDVIAKTWAKGGIAVADVDPEVEIARARRALFHLRERVPDSYRVDLHPDLSRK